LTTLIPEGWAGFGDVGEERSMTGGYVSSTHAALSFRGEGQAALSKVKSSGRRAKRLIVSYCARCAVESLNLGIDLRGGPRVGGQSGVGSKLDALIGGLAATSRGMGTM